MSTNNMDSTRSKIQLEKLRERNKSLELANKAQEQSILEWQDKIRQKEIELVQIRDERDDLRIKWAVMEAEMKNVQNALKLSNQAGSQKKSILKRQGLMASLMFLFSSVLVNIGTTQLTSNPPNELGWVMMALASALYLVAALMTTVFAEGGN